MALIRRDTHHRSRTLTHARLTRIDQCTLVAIIAGRTIGSVCLHRHAIDACFYGARVVVVNGPVRIVGNARQFPRAIAHLLLTIIGRLGHDGRIFRCE